MVASKKCLPVKYLCRQIMLEVKSSCQTKWLPAKRASHPNWFKSKSGCYPLVVFCDMWLGSKKKPEPITKHHKKGSLVHPVSEFRWGLPAPNGDHRRSIERDKVTEIILYTTYLQNRMRGRITGSGACTYFLLCRKGLSH